MIGKFQICLARFYSFAGFCFCGRISLFDCERVLVTLLRGLGPWKDSVFLVGGLTPRYLVPARPPAVPAHAGTLDVDVVIALQILTDTSRSGDLLAGGGALRDTKREPLRPVHGSEEVPWGLSRGLPNKAVSGESTTDGHGY